MLQSVIFFLQGRRLQAFMALAFVALGTVSPGLAQSQDQENSLKAFLQNYQRKTP
jgi:hypothetical protein